MSEGSRSLATLSGATRRQDFLRWEGIAFKLGHSAVRGGVANVLFQVAAFGVRLVSSMFLARLLTPHDFGLVAIVLAFVSVLQPFRDFGLSTATLQREALSHEEVTNLFWVNSGIGLALTVSLVIIAPMMNYFCAEPRLTLTAVALSTMFLFEGLSAQHQALLRRKMKFASLASLQVSAQATAAVAAIWAAWMGIGHWALVLQQLLMPAGVAVGVWVLCSWRPDLPFRRHPVHGMVRFGGQLTGANFLYALGGNSDKVLIGWRWGPGALGLYSKAFALLLLPIAQLTTPLYGVAVASLSRLQNNPERFRRFYCRLVTLLAYATTPVLVVLAVISRDVILLVLGDQWVEASTIFTVLAIAAVGQPVAGGTVGWVFASLGQTDRMLRWTLFAVPVTILSSLIGLPWGALGVATAYAIQSHLLRLPTLWYAFRFAPLKVGDFLGAIWRPFVVSGFMFVATLGASHYFATEASLLRLVYCGTIGGTVFLTSIVLWPRTRREALDLAKETWRLWAKPAQ